MEAVTSNEDVLVLLQTENGEQIALPMSALPSDFVPGDSGQIIMVESTLEEQQEVVVESSDATDPQSKAASLVSLHLDKNQTSFATNDVSMTTDVLFEGEVSALHTHSTNLSDKPAPRTYSKNSVVKSYAPTCGITRIYQQSESTQSQPSDSAKSDHPDHSDLIVIEPAGVSQTDSIVQSESSTPNIVKEDNQIADSNSSAASQTPQIPHKKQKRKETLQTRPLNEEDMKLEFQVIEEQLPLVTEFEVKRKPRKEYRTKKKVRLAMEKLSKEEYANLVRDMKLRDREAKSTTKRHEPVDIDEAKEEMPDKDEPSEEEVEKGTPSKELKKELPKREIPKRGKDKSIEPVKPQIQTPQPERRTRLSNACRVATGKSYRCNDCDFSTDRINNIIIHVKESCPKLKRV